MPNEPRRQVQDIFTTCAQAQYNSPQETTPRGFTISTMTTTTFTATNVTSALVGCWAMPADGLRDYPRMIKSVVLATATATVDRAWSSTTGVTTIRVWSPPEVPYVVTSGGSTGAVASPAHASITNEPDNYWNSTTKGYFLMGYGGANAGSVGKGLVFVSSNGGFTISPALGSTPAHGDLFLLRKLLRPEAPPEITVNMKTISRRVVGYKDGDAAVPVTIEANVAFTLPQRPIGTAASTAGVFPTAPLEIGDLLDDFMTPTLQAGMTVASASGTTLAVSSATATVGGYVLLHTGEVVQLLSVSSNNYTVGSGQMTAPSVAASVGIGCVWYQFKTADFRNRLFDNWRGGLHRQTIYGCAPSVDIEVNRDQVVKFNFKYVGDSAFEYASTNPVTSTTRRIPLLDTTVPFDGKAARFLINGTKVLCGDLKINLGITPIPRPCLQGVNQMDGYTLDLAPVTWSTTILADQDDVSGFEIMTDRLRGGDVLNILYQKGSTATNTFVIGMPAAQLTKCTLVPNAGQYEYQLEGTCQIPELSGLGATIPAFSMAWL